MCQHTQVIWRTVQKLTTGWLENFHKYYAASAISRLKFCETGNRERRARTIGYWAQCVTLRTQEMIFHSLYISCDCCVSCDNYFSCDCCVSCDDHVSCDCCDSCDDRVSCYCCVSCDHFVNCHYTALHCTVVSIVVSCHRRTMFKNNTKLETPPHTHATHPAGDTKFRDVM